MRWVEAHRVGEQVVAEKGSLVDWAGNLYADKLADAAAERSQPSDSERDAVKQLFTLVAKVQRRMLVAHMLAVEAAKGTLAERQFVNFRGAPDDLELSKNSGHA